MAEKRVYCVYCGRVAHRCLCEEVNSDLQKFLVRNGKIYKPQYRDNHYKRGVPPQIKKRERANMRKHYQAWYQQLVEAYGEVCANCGESEKPVIDHILPIAKGGLSEMDNLQLLCATCNRIKGKLVIDCRNIE